MSITTLEVRTRFEARIALPSLLLALLFVSIESDAQMLSVQGIDGPAQLVRGKRQQAVVVDAGLQLRDTLKLDEDSRAVLRLGRHGMIRAEPGTELTVEKLPLNAFADDLGTVIRLGRGSLHVIWKQPPAEIAWPFSIALDRSYAAVATGEYFFDKDGDHAATCVVEGELKLSGAESRTLKADSCLIVDAGQPPRLAALADRRSVPEPLARGPDAEMTGPVSAPATPASAPEPVVGVPPPVAVQAPAPTPAPVPIAPAPAAPPDAPPAVVAPIASAPVPAPPPVVPGWTVNIASLPEQASAETVAERVRKGGFPAVVVPTEVKGATWYRVQVRGLASRPEAVGVAAKLKTVSQAKAWILRE